MVSGQRPLVCFTWKSNVPSPLHISESKSEKTEMQATYMRLQHNCNLYVFYLQMKYLVQLLGQPEDHLLKAGIYTNQFFSQVDESDGETWRLKVSNLWNIF